MGIDPRDERQEPNGQCRPYRSTSIGGSQKREFADGNTAFVALGFIFVFFILLLHAFAFIHFDDFGYGSLTYGWDGNKHGMNWTLTDLASFLRWHYFSWGGRILYFAPLCLLLKTGEWAIRLVQSCIVVGTAFLTYHLTKRAQADSKAWVLSLVIFGAFNISCMADGILWYTASVLYVWPFFPLLLGLLCIGKSKKTPITTFIGLISMFFAGFSQEQIAVMVITYCCIMLIVQIRLRGFEWQSTLIALFGIIGALCEILAPGNFVRAGNSDNAAFYQLSLFQKMTRNLPGIVDNNLGPKNAVFAVILILTLILISLQLRNHPTPLLKNISIPVLISSALLVSSWILSPGAILSFVVQLLFAAVFFVAVSATLLQQKEYSLYALLIGGILSQGMMILSPTTTIRVSLPLQGVLHIIVIYVICHAPDCGWHKRAAVWGVTAIALLNFAIILVGYGLNASTHAYNHYVLRDKAQRIAEGESINAIVLYRLPNDAFSPNMPYKTPFMTYWVKQYYEIPQDVSILWDSFGTPGHYHQSVQVDSPIIESISPSPINRDQVPAGGSFRIYITPSVMVSGMQVIVDGTAVQSKEESQQYVADIPSTLLEGDDITIVLRHAELGLESNAVTVAIETLQ